MMANYNPTIKNISEEENACRIYYSPNPIAISFSLYREMYYDSCKYSISRKHNMDYYSDDNITIYELSTYITNHL